LPGREDIPKPGVPVPGFRGMRASGRSAAYAPSGESLISIAQRDKMDFMQLCVFCGASLPEQSSVVVFCYINSVPACILGI